MSASPPGQPLSRREFLKVSGLYLSSLALAGSPLLQQGEPLPADDGAQYGRVTDEFIRVYDAPTFAANPLRNHYRDTVLPLQAVTIGRGEPAHNQVWYQLGNGGFAHSGALQPVRIQANDPLTDLPAGGSLAEVTVPFTDTHWKPDKVFPRAYRLYYETAHWVSEAITDRDGNIWYRLVEDKWQRDYFALAQHLRLLPPEELAPISPQVPPEAKRIEVLTSLQAVVAYEYERPVYMARAATGAVFSNGNFSTPPGRHTTFHKRPFRHMAAGNLAFNGYDLPGVPWICYFTRSGISFHGTYWHNNYGRPRSHGCVNLTPCAAKWFYLWSFPTVPADQQFTYEDPGTPVDVI